MRHSKDVDVVWMFFEENNEGESPDNAAPDTFSSDRKTLRSACNYSHMTIDCDNKVVSNRGFPGSIEGRRLEKFGLGFWVVNDPHFNFKTCRARAIISS